MNIAHILVGGRIQSGPALSRRRGLVTIIRDGRLMTGRPAPKGRKK